LILVDTSVWIDHFKNGVVRLRALLEQGLVLTHPFVVGELACGNLRNRAAIMADLARLPLIRPATHSEVLRLVEERRLWGKGVGWIDAHLLAAALIIQCRLWTHDRRLAVFAQRLQLTD
jgi:predicted nucleic acid-binding protein